MAQTPVVNGDVEMETDADVPDSEENERLSDDEGGFTFEDIYIPPPFRPACTFDSTGPRLIVTSIENENFKSYAGRQVLGPFHKRFNAIVGPNGSGKSNVIDSMLFVFGYRASKLRSKKISVLLHNSDGHRDINSCTVAVNFVQIIDKDEDFEIVPNSRISISRTAFKDNSSYYTLNGRRVQFKEVAKLLRSHGVDLDFNRFLILQGEVEQIAMMKPKALSEHEVGMLEFLEDIIGTTRYKEPIIKLNSRLDELIAERAEKVNRLKFAEQEKIKLEGPRNEAISYLKLKNEITLKKNIYLQKLLQIDSVKAAAKEEEKRQIDEEMESINTKLRSIQTKKKNVEKDVGKISHELSKFNDKRDRAHEIFTEANRAELHMKENMTTLEKSSKKTNELLEEERKKYYALELIPAKSKKEIAELLQLEEKLKKQQVEEQARVDEILEELRNETQAEQEIKEKLQTKLIILQKAVDETKSALDIAQSSLDLYVSNEQKEKGKFEQMETHFESISSMLEQRKSEIKELQVKIPETSRNLKQTENELTQVCTEQRSVAEELQSVRVKMEEMRANLQASRSHGRVVSALMQEKQSGRLPGIFGRLGDLGAIDKKYDVAISTVCGRLDNIVVDTVTTGQRCIEFLKKNNVGRTSIIILEKQQHLWSNCNAAYMPPGPSQRLFDLIRVEDDNLRPAFYFALRDTLVTATLREATEVAYGTKRHRVVTLDGQIIEPSGTMSGGGRNKKRGGMGQQVTVSSVSPQSKSNLEEKVTKLDSTASSLREKRSKLEQEVDSLTSKLSSMQLELNKTSTEIKTMEEQVPVLGQQMKQQSKKVKEATADPAQVKKLTAERDVAEKAYNKAAEAADSVDKKVKVHHAVIVEITGSRTKDARKKVDDITKKMEKAQKERTRLNVGIKTAQRNYDKCKEKISNMETEVEEGSNKLIRLQQERKETLEKVATFQSEMRSMAAKCMDLEEEIQNLNQQISEISRDESDLKALIADKHPKMDTIVHELKAVQAMVTKTRRELKDLKYLEVPGEPPNDDLVVLTEEELQHIDEKPASYAVVLLETKLVDFKPNLAVLQEYKEKENLYIKRVEELEEVTSRRNNARNILEDVRKRRLTDFMDGYSIITIKLKEMYQTITLGGDAEFELVDSMDPFSEGIVFSVRPPKKSWKNISNLSGGEKTLSSLALVFALHYYKPSPLYIMDEIDAALDFRNVSIVGNYIKERTKNAQFIVISLRANMFELADQLVGIYKTYNCTKSITINPNSYNTV